MSMPETLIVQASSFQQTQNPLIMKPVFGSMGTQTVRFHNHKIYNATKSKAENKEAFDTIELCEIRNDAYCKVPLRVKTRDGGSELSREQQTMLAGLYERFKSQRESGETSIMDWEAIEEGDRSQLAQLGIFSVEQLFAHREHELYKLGPGGEELHERAARHMNSKMEEKKKLDAIEELALIRAEKEQLAAEREKANETMFKLQAQIAELQGQAPKRGPGRPKSEAQA